MLGLLTPCYKGKPRYAEAYNLSSESYELVAEGSKGLVIAS